MVKKVLITSVDKDKGSGGNKAKRDIKFFLKSRMNFQTFDMAIDGSHRFEKYWFINTKLRSYIKKSRPEILFFQYPNLHFFVMNKLVIIYRKYVPNGRIYFIVHDIMGWQFAHREEILNQEISLFNRTDGLVVHNAKMKQFLIKHNVTVPMTELQIFDYANDYSFAPASDYAKICFPGNLGKSTFLEKVDIKTPLNIYGSNRAENYPANVKYCGNFSSEEIAGKLKESYGLIWDGNSVTTCSGSVGEYLKINNPHKASLYISAGIPVIAWEDAAIADIINHYQVGFTINSLEEIDTQIKKLQSKYQVMKENTEELAKKLRNGDFITSAVNQLIAQ